ncbi:hypothetical protein HHK36_004982 [Tetracentron sinense]|uniref:Phospho-N-acetylmuramoyl-pentapeptide-transferase n=1 Tax=Tetracentron sinense TaxID=13715 RepID=A0A834ZMA6_TETSI|nr:hypothetical protein HHK36_004982 [Tetracentron sinense]
MDFSSLDEWGDSEGISGGSSYILSSSEGEDSDIELLINPVGDVDFPASEHLDTSDGDITVTSHRLAVLQKGGKTNSMGVLWVFPLSFKDLISNWFFRDVDDALSVVWSIVTKSRKDIDELWLSSFFDHGIYQGVFINVGLIASLVILLLFVDWWSWRIVRLPLAPFYLTRPFFISAVLASCAGYVCVPLLDSLKLHQIFRKEGPVAHFSKKGTPTMGGLFFIPIGVTVARFIAGFSSVEVSGAVAATLAFGAIGFLDDILSFTKNHNYGLPAWIKILLEARLHYVLVFPFPHSIYKHKYNLKILVPLPAPLGLVYLGKLYLLLTAFCFTSMGNGVNLTDGLDGLAGGTAALAFIGMSIAVLPICSDLAVFGASMAGACVGFLLHNRYKASVFMGDTGSLALGGALAAMAACTGMFFPLFISSGIFVLEASSVIMQISYKKTTKRLYGTGQRLFRMAPFHHHLELCGLKEPVIVASTYIVSFVFALFAGYVGLISA